MELPTTSRNNCYVVVFPKCPLVFPTPDQKAVRIAKLLAEVMIPMFGCPESLLSDGVLATLMQDVCEPMSDECLKVKHNGIPF